MWIIINYQDASWNFYEPCHAQKNLYLICISLPYFFSHYVNWKKNICKRVVRRQIMDSVELQIFFWEFLSTNFYRYWTVKFMEYTHIFFLFQNSAICLNTKRQNCAFYESWNIQVHIFHLSSLNNLHLFPKRLSSVNVELNQHLPSKSIFNRKFFNVQGNL